MTRLLKKKNGGFTLIELMIVVVIIGILAATAIPAFIRFVKRSKTAEAGLQVKALFMGAASYYGMELTEQGFAANISMRSACIVPDASTGLVPDSDKHQYSASSAGAGAASFAALDWGPVDLLYYNYRITGGNTTSTCGNGGGTTIVALQTFSAHGDLDDDGVTSNFEMAAGFTPDDGFGHAPLYFLQGTELE